MGEGDGKRLGAHSPTSNTDHMPAETCITSWRVMAADSGTLGGRRDTLSAGWNRGGRARRVGVGRSSGVHALTTCVLCLDERQHAQASRADESWHFHLGSALCPCVWKCAVCACVFEVWG